MTDLSKITLTDPDILKRPYPHYEILRKQAPVYFDERLHAFVVTRYADVQQAVRMPEVLSNELAFAEVMRSPWQDEIDEFMWKEGFGPHIITNTLQVDPPKHARRRKFISDAFNAHAATAMEPQIKQVVQEAMAPWLDTGETDLMRAYAQVVPILTICELLDFPKDRVAEMGQWADSAVGQVSLQGDKEEAYFHARNVMDLQRFIMEAVEERRKNPGDDLISQLVYARIDDDEQPTLTPEELMPMCVVVVAGGIDTTRNGIAWGCYNLAGDPELFQLLKHSDQQEKLLRQFIEETLRQQGPVPQLPRKAREDCEIGGVAIPKGSNVFISWAAANHDEEKFPEPEKFDIHRKNAGTHLAFGTGIHRCVGNMVARMEMKCALLGLLQELETLELTCTPEELEIDASIVLRGPARLPARFTR